MMMTLALMIIAVMMMAMAVMMMVITTTKMTMMTRVHRQVPTCYGDEQPNNGYYHHMCIYNIFNVSGGHICYCTDDNGTYNGLDYVNGQCSCKGKGGMHDEWMVVRLPRRVFRSSNGLS